jgi:hypothetical protein
LLFTLVEFGSRRLDLPGQIQPVLTFFLDAVPLWWQGWRQAERRWCGISDNKPFFFLLRHLVWLCRSSNQIVDLWIL